MIESLEQKAPDVRDLKQQLNIAKEQRMELVIKLGEMAHNHLREIGGDIVSLKNISTDILHKDVLIYQTQHAITKLSANHQCQKCQQTVDENAKFCGNCGTLNINFIDPNARQVICGHCEQLIEEQHIYCPCCGIKQEGK